jgi:DNA-binding CsgD family transcriptional regulator
MPSVGKPGSALTARETQVMVLVARGDSYVQIADALRCNPSTVRSHVGSVMARLGAHDADAAVIAWRRGEQERGMCQRCGEDPAGATGKCEFCVQELGAAA